VDGETGEDELEDCGHERERMESDGQNSLLKARGDSEVKKWTSEVNGMVHCQASENEHVSMLLRKE